MPEPTLDDLRWALRTQADDVIVPPPPLDAVAAGVTAHRASRRRRGALGILAAAVVVGLLVVAGVRSDPASTPDPSETPTQTPERKLRTLEDLERGPATDVAYTLGSTLVMGSRRITFPQQIIDLDQAGDSVVVVLGARYRVVLIDSRTGNSQVLAPTSGGSVAIAPDAGVVAWVKADDSATVVLHWLDGTGGTNEQTFPADPSCCDNPFVINGITGAGQLIASLPSVNRSWVWDYPRLLLSAPQPGDDVRRIRGLGGLSITGVLDSGIVGTDASDPEYAFRTGPIEGDRFRPEAEIDGGQQVYFDDTGRAVVVRTDGAVVVRDRDTGGDPSDDRPLRLPPGSGVQGMVRETERTVLLDVWWSDGSAYELTALVRCDLEDLTCEKVANIPRDQRLIF